MGFGGLNLKLGKACYNYIIYIIMLKTGIKNGEKTKILDEIFA